MIKIVLILGTVAWLTATSLLGLWKASASSGRQSSQKMGAFLCGRKKYCNNSNHNHKKDYKVVSLTKGKKVESVVFIVFWGLKLF
jgi:hypothetical protein